MLVYLQKLRQIIYSLVIIIIIIVHYITDNNQKQERRRMAIPFETPSTSVMMDNDDDRDNYGDDLDDYCHTICQLHQCVTGRQDYEMSENQCVCYDEGERRCEI